jgi:hypothetical protein
MNVFSVLDELRDRAALIPGVQVVAEAHTATPGSLIRLEHQQPSAVTVTDGGLVTYSAGLDYEVQRAGILILPTFTGVSGSAVEISYTWNTVQSSRVGLESTLTPDDYPIVRLVPSRITRGTVKDYRKIEVLLYFGLPLYEELDAGLEGIYQALLIMEQQLLDAVRFEPEDDPEPDRGYYRCRYLETITDEDRLEHYKLMAIRCEVEG